MGERGGLGVFRGAWEVINFSVAVLHALNCISAIKLLAISKTTELEFFIFLPGQNGVVGDECLLFFIFINFYLLLTLFTSL